MSLKIIALDTSVVVFLCQSTPPTETKALKRWQLVHGNAVQLFKDAKLVLVPAPVIVELCAGGNDGERIAQKLAGQSQRLRIAALDKDAAIIAGKLIEPTLKTRPDDLRRNVLKFDALIMGIAASSSADAILTTNGSDFSKLATLIGDLAPSPQVLNMDEVLKGQLSLPAVSPTNVVKFRDR
jgi:predicted nucleic acid-binding protein